ncbi:GntR family transcriptional regulator [Streptomyces sp. RB6PN25]|uniref:GntR family transcriptional regulator n=2 Tax=Streptomyces humicola TaxID=2953240 RepID=A0ABT1Q0V1_9ACTN|nr:GntR family transcriptional regulator [Streptomyces humicola]
MERSERSDPFGGVPAEQLVPGRASAAQLVAGVLRDRIAAGALLPGDRLSEESLGERLGVSRNTLREAFRMLAEERLVVHEMNRGVFVRVLAPDDVSDIYVVRRALETAGVRADPPSPGAVQAVAAAVADGEAAAEAGDWTAVGNADLRFHRAIGALTGSERVDAALTGVLTELRLAFAVMPSPRPFHEPFLHRNRELSELLSRGERRRAEHELTTYLEDARVMITDRMTEAEA